VSRAFPQLDEGTEAAVLAGVRRGGAGRGVAFDVIFRALRLPVLELCLHVAGRRSDAEDAMQETFLAVYRALPAFRGESGISTWVFRIALRAALQLRARRRDHVEVDPELPAPGSGEVTLEARDEARRVQAALGALSAEHRSVLGLFALEGLGHAAIAEILGIPEGTVWSRLHAARVRLREILERSASR
jgi:RNA polymerase sigma-70 factor (ECF subfamily)